MSLLPNSIPLMTKRTLPPRSPYSLIQEDTYPNEWLMFIVCIMLNCTRRSQVDGVLREFVHRWPKPEEFMNSHVDDVMSVCRPLGFVNRRTKNMMLMTEAYLKRDWKNPRDLPGIGEYGGRSWEMFYGGVLGDERPKDGALGRYWEWRRGANTI